MKNSTITKADFKKHPEGIITGSDIVAVSILKEIYSTLKSKSAAKLDKSEKLWVKEIEAAYKYRKILEERQVVLFLDQAVKFISDKTAWTAKDEELYSLVEKITFLRAREDVFKKFFNSMEDTIISALQLDFSKRVPLSNIMKDKRNIFNYASLSLNMIMEKMEKSVVSMNSVTHAFASIPGIALLITDSLGNIRYSNDLADELLGISKNDFIRNSISKVFQDYSKINKRFQTKSFISDMDVNLIHQKQKNILIPVTLTIPKISIKGSEMEEHVYILKTKDWCKTDLEFNLTQESHDKIAPLNTILSAVSLLKTKFIDNQSKELFDIVINCASQLKNDASNKLTMLSTGDDMLYKEVQKIDFKKLIDNILESLKGVEGFDKMVFKKEIKVGNLFYCNSILLHSVLQNLICNAIKYSKKNKINNVQIIVEKINTSVLQIIVKDSGIGIKKENLETIFDKYSSTSIMNNDSFGLGLYIVKEAINKLNGEINVSSKENIGTSFIVQLPFKMN